MLMRYAAWFRSFVHSLSLCEQSSTTRPIGAARVMMRRRIGVGDASHIGEGIDVGDASHVGDASSVPLLCRRCAAFAVVLSVVLLTAAAPAVAERPSSMKLFPEETLLFVRTSNAYEFGQRLRDGSMGRMLRDPQLKPFVEKLYGEVGEVYAEKAEAVMGVSWEDLQKVPHGEVAFGVVARDAAAPAFLLLIDQGDELSVADGLLERAMELAAERGAEFSTEMIGDVEVIVVRAADDENRVFGVFERERTLVVATDPNVLRGVLWHWDHAGEPLPPEAAVEIEEAIDDADVDVDETEEEVFIPGRTLAENDRFTQILSTCRRPQDPPPHLIAFANPVELVRNFGRDQGGVQFAMGLLPSLGLDGFLGVGASFTAATDQYDDLSHIHVLLENPRAGVLQLPTFEKGNTAPQPFVPLAMENYWTWHWNMQTFYNRLEALVDRYRYEGSVDKLIEERISEPLGIDFQTEVLDNLSGRYTWLIGYEKPARFRGQQHVIVAEVKDESAAIQTLDKVRDKFAGIFKKEQFGQVAYYAITPAWLEGMEEEDRPFSPCVAVMDGHLFLSGSRNLFERCVAARDGTVDRLVDSSDYSRVTEVLGRETAGTTPAMLAITRSEESIRQWYDLLTSERTRELIDEHKEENPLLAALADAMDQHALPPFEILARYMPPGGAILYDTDNGYHGISFTLRNRAK